MKKNDNWKVYKHTNLINGKVYIGVTKQNVQRRWRDGEGYRTQMFYRAIQKYGWDNFKHEVLADWISSDKIDRYETYLVELYRSDDPNFGYNLEGGGKINKVVSAETREKMRALALNRVVSQETREKISKANKGKKRPECGHSKNKGRKHSKEFGMKISMAKKGKVAKRDKETEDRISAQFSGGGNPAAINVICNQIIYGSVSECADVYGVHKDSMRMWLRGTRAMPQEFIDMGLNYLNEDLRIDEFKVQKKFGKRSRKVICLNTGEVFESILLAKEKYNAFNIAICCKGKVKSAGKHPTTGEALRWMYYEEYLLENKEEDDVLCKTNI